MAIGRAISRPLVSSSALNLNTQRRLSAPILRCVSGVARVPSAKAKIQTSKPKIVTVKRFIPEDVKRFVKPDGKLLTTRENRDFLLEHGLEHDNGQMIRLSAGSELSRLGSEFNATFAYSPRHIIHPYDLRFFEPRGHPLAPMQRAKYTQKTEQEPMWVIITSGGGVSAVVRTLTQRRLTRSIFEALGELGYRSVSHDGIASKARGTLWITLHNPAKAASHSPERFGRVVAKALAKHCSW